MNTSKNELQRIGLHLQRTRKSRSLTLEDIADVHGINRATIIKIEKGNGGTSESLIRYCEAMSLTIMLTTKTR